MGLGFPKTIWAESRSLERSLPLLFPIDPEFMVKVFEDQEGVEAFLVFLAILVMKFRSHYNFFSTFLAFNTICNLSLIHI